MKAKLILPLLFTLIFFTTCQKDEEDEITCDLTVSASVTGISATATASLGTPPYVNYAWSNGGSGATVSGLAPGTYTVTVTDNTGCTASASASATVSGGCAGATTMTDGDGNVYPI